MQTHTGEHQNKLLPVSFLNEPQDVGEYTRHHYNHILGPFLWKQALICATSLPISIMSDLHSPYYPK